MLRGDRILMAAIVVVSLVWSVIAMKAMQTSLTPEESSFELHQARIVR